MCFVNIPGSLDSGTDNWYECYLSSDQVDRIAVNLIINEVLVLDTAAISHCSAAIRYTISEVLSQYFSQAMQKDKVMYKNSKQAMPAIKQAVNAIAG